jgi:hypothetical protein
VDDVAMAVRHGLRWMEQSQRRDGSWQGESPLSTIHATTRCLRAFLGAGFPISYPSVAKAGRWLVRPRSEGSIYHYFWRLGALSEFEGIQRETLEHDFDVVVHTIDSGLMLDRKLNYHAFLFDCAANCGLGANFPEKAAELVKQLESPRIDVTPALWGFVGLERCGYSTSDMQDKVVSLILSCVQNQNGLYHLNGLVAETSFLVFNVCRSPELSKDTRIRPIVLGAARWIVARQKDDGSWPIEPPLYNGDPQCVAYFTGVATRALSEYIRRYSPLRLAEVFVADWRLHVFLRAVVKVGVGLAVIALAGTLSALLLPSRWTVLVTILSVTSSAIEIALFGISVKRRLSSV